MKILVIDDDRLNLDAALVQLTEHDVAVAETYDAGERMMQNGIFDAVLVDLMLPASRNCLSPKVMNLAGEQMPVGVFLALQAAMHGAKYVGLLTDMDHHQHPASACLDWFLDEDNLSQPFTVNHATVIMTNDDHLMSDVFRDDLSRHPSPEDWGTMSQQEYLEVTVRVKNWARLLELLVDAEDWVSDLPRRSQKST